MTCHNRKEKTLRCLQSLAAAVEAYGGKWQASDQQPSIAAHVFLTDDGCTDGTVEALQTSIRPMLASRLHVIEGDGTLYWAGGMRAAWRAAMAREEHWDYYLLLNDDTVVSPDAFTSLFAAEDYCRKQFGSEGIVSGMTGDPADPARITYGGEVFISRLTCRRRMLGVSDVPQRCDWTHANILLVPRYVVERQGILYGGYRHGQADLDYGYRARRAGIPVVVTAKVCGICAFDHPDIGDIEKRLCAMTLQERRQYLNHPLHSDADYLTMIRRCMPAKYPLTWFFRKMNLYTPRLYYWLNKKR